jgi:hypothetical protein
MPTKRTTPTLPPDPERMNRKRASWAKTAIEAFGAETGQTIKGDGAAEIVMDLIADIAHFCDRARIRLDDLYFRAETHYSTETNGQGSQFSPTLKPGH